jgi:hypothetical protein
VRTPRRRRGPSPGLLAALALGLGIAPAAPAALAAQAPDVELAFTGMILFNGFYDDAAVNTDDVPEFVLPSTPEGRRAQSLSGTVRQTRLTLEARVEEVAGATVTGLLDTDFYGGQQPSAGGRTFPLPRIRRAFAELAWPRVTLLVGQESPPIAAVSPASLATVALPGFAGAGNLWLWLPQVRLGGELPVGGVRLGLEAAALAPTAGEPQDPFLTRPDRAEQSGRPYLQMRAVLRKGDRSRPAEMIELSVGGHIGWLATGSDSLVESRALAASAWVPLGPVELRGEAFVGRALAGLGLGGIGQSLGPGDRPVDTRGGWIQLLVRPLAAVELGASGGLDDPDDEDLGPVPGRLKNRILAGHLLWRQAPLVTALELRHLRTSYPGPTGGREAVHVNLALGFEF